MNQLYKNSFDKNLHNYSELIDILLSEIEKSENNLTQQGITTEKAVTESVIETFPIADESKTGYVKSESAQLRDNMTTTSAITVKVKKRSKIKIEEEKKDEKGKLWTKITAKVGDKTVLGWTFSENIV